MSHEASPAIRTMIYPRRPDLLQCIQCHPVPKHKVSVIEQDGGHRFMVKLFIHPADLTLRLVCNLTAFQIAPQRLNGQVQRFADGIPPWPGERTSVGI